MTATAVWLMVVLNTNGTWSTGTEFTTEAKCKQAAIVVQKAVEDVRWGSNIKMPLCVKIEK